MAIRQIRVIGDEILTKACKPVKEMNERTEELIEDMFETMYENNGCGLAAPQVGIRKRIVVIDVDDGNQYVMINPEILETSGSQTGAEGCLSVPGKNGQVTRAEHVKAKALNENMEEYTLAVAHAMETDEYIGELVDKLTGDGHMDGILYVERVEGELHDNDEEGEE